ncbi:hypothetical protein BC938DRAFT_479846 [Jimgerdemannia flammicorona]|uniref:Galactose oxidase n=1 Tax=Jimgerdemannia flammicorona TaxID=994334 RepID=A0A433QXU2_9FUNG|nr:hypothetical protein BC938DRAFT_479846 [Jimgerdemannia flammicorona]
MLDNFPSSLEQDRSIIMARTTFPALLPLISLIPYLVTAANPSGSWGQATVSINNSIYVHGGEGVSGTISNLYTLDSSQPWSTANPPWTDLTSNAGTFTVPQTALQAMWPAADGKSFYIWGGGNDHHITQAQSGFAQYNVITGTWSLPSAISGMPVQRKDLRAAWSSSGVVYLWAGWGDITYTTTWTLRNATGNTPDVRRYSAAVLSSDGLSIIICFGGTQSSKVLLNGVAVLDSRTWSWTQPAISGTLPTPRMGHSAVMVNGQMIVFFATGYHDSVAYAAPVPSPYHSAATPSPMSNIPMGPPNPYPYGQPYTPIGYPPIPNTPQHHYAVPPYQNGHGQDPPSTWTK